jgi:hypothetical protein
MRNVGKIDSAFFVRKLVDKRAAFIVDKYLPIEEFGHPGFRHNHSYFQ